MLPEVNLLPKYERSDSVLYNIFIIGLIAVALLSAVQIYFYINTKNSVEDAEARVAELKAEKDILEKSIAVLESDDIFGFESAVAYVDSYRQPVSKLVNEFITLLPDHSYLSKFSYNYDTVNIDTQFESIKDSSVYIADLTDSAYLENVVIDSLGTITYDSEINETEERYEVLPRYRAEYSMQINHQSLTREEESDEESVSGE